MLKSHEPKVFASKIDGWLIAVLVIAALYPIAIGVYAVATNPKHGLSALLATLATSGVFLLIVWLLAFPISYTVADGQVRIRAGLLIRKTIDLADIVEVSPSRNPVSSPALSLDRVAIKVLVNGKPRLAVLISPEEKTEFMLFLSKLDGGLKYDGAKLTRKR